MRTRALALVGLLALPAASGAQLRLPRIGRRAAPEPAAPLPPEAAGVHRALAYKRSRWTTESYSMFSGLQVGTPLGPAARYSTVGAGTRAAYRYTDNWSGSMDFTYVPNFGQTSSETVEIGTRFAPLPWEEQIRPFFDLRAAYMHMYDQFATPMNPSGGVGGFDQLFGTESRYSRGFGAVGGAGMDVSITNTLALSTELTVLRGRMRAYQLSGPAALPLGGPSYWMTSARIAFGIKYNPVSALHLAQTVTH